MQSASKFTETAPQPFLPQGMFHKAFFVLGLVASLYFANQYITQKLNPVAPISKKRLHKKSNQARYMATADFRPENVLPVSRSQELKMNTEVNKETHSYSLQAEAAPVEAASAAVSAEATPDPALKPAEVGTEAQESDTQLINAYTPFTGPAATDFIDSSQVKTEQNIDPNAAALQKEILADKFIPHAPVSASTSYSHQGSSSTAPAAAVNLSAQDLALITGRAITAMNEDLISTVSGVSCTQSTPAACSPQSALNVSNSRWSLNQGIKNTGTALTVQNVSGQVQFTFNFVIQDHQQRDVPVTLVLKPTDVNMSEETIANINYKTFQFGFADATAHGESIKQLKLNLTYHSNGSLSVVQGNVSEFSFVRSNFSTVSHGWITGGQNAINSSEAILKPDAQRFVFKLQ